MRGTVEQRFWAKVDRRGPDECWPWKAGNDGIFGYGHMRCNGPLKKASHISLELDGRPRVAGLDALHSCDNPPCVNPAHLRWGTKFENMADMVERNRHGAITKPDRVPRGDRSGPRTKPESIPRGEARGHARLTDVQVRVIRMCSNPARDLVKHFGVSGATISRVRKYRLWKHVA